MFSCKDCVHYEICLPNSQAYGHKLKPCTKFKNKADVVEVVRCKDCRKHDEDAQGNIYCVEWGGYCSDTDYCSYGERKML